MVHHRAMLTLARLRFAATLLVSLLGFVLTLDTPETGQLGALLSMQAPLR